MKRILAYILIILLVAGGLYFILTYQKTEQVEIKHDMIVSQIEELGRLELLKYNIRDIIEYEKIRNWLPNSKTALIVVGEVVACVDLTAIKSEDITITGDSVSLLLPAPEICQFKIDHSRSRVYNVQYGFWETPKLVDEAYREAELQLYRQALEMGIAEESRTSAQKVLTNFLSLLGFKKVSIYFKNPSLNSNFENQNIHVIPHRND